MVKKKKSSKRKPIKRAFKKKNSKKTTTKKATIKKKVNKEEQLRNKFYNFQKKVDRLEEFKHELKSLESRNLTKGFEKEVGIIHSRLKDTTALPDLERRMKALRKKIRDKREVKRKNPIKILARKIDKIDDDVEETGDELKKEIKDLKSKLETALNRGSKVNSEMGLVVDGEFQKFINSMKIDLSNKLRERESELSAQMRNELFLKRKELAVKHDRFNTDKRKGEVEIRRKLYELNKEHIENNHKMQVFKLALKKQVTKEAHDALISKMLSYKKNVNTKLGKEFKDKLEEFVNKQTISHNKEIISHNKEILSKTKELNGTLLNQKKINENLNQNVSKLKYNLEQRKQKVRELLESQISRKRDFSKRISLIRHRENSRRMREKHDLVLKHNMDIENITDKLKAEFNNNFERDIAKRALQEKNKLNVEYSRKKEELKSTSFRQRREARIKLKEQFGIELKRRVVNINKQLREKYTKDFETRSNQEITLEKKKLNNKLREMENNHKLRENALKLKERDLIEREKTKANELAGEKRKILDKLIVMRSQEEIILKNQRIKLQKEISDEMHKNMIEELKKREELMKSKFQKELDAKIKISKQVQEAQLAKKRAELAKELQDKARLLLG